MRIGHRRGRPLPRHGQPFLDPEALRDGGPARRRACSRTSRDGTLRRDLDIPDRIARARRAPRSVRCRRGPGALEEARAPPARAPAARGLLARSRADRLLEGRHGRRPRRPLRRSGSTRRARSRVPVRDWGWLSSEARGSIPISDDGRGGVLTVGIELLRVRRRRRGRRRPRRPRRAGASCGARRARDRATSTTSFLTTNGGLYRYDINDVVAVEGCHNGRPVIEFRRKGRGVTSLTGEKVSVDPGHRGLRGGRARRSRSRSTTSRRRPTPTPAATSSRSRRGAGSRRAARVPLLQALDDELGAPQHRVPREAQEPAPQRRRMLHVMRAGWYDAREAAAGRRRPAHVPGEDGHPLAGDLPRSSGTSRPVVSLDGRRPRRR